MREIGNSPIEAWSIAHRRINLYIQIQLKEICLEPDHSKALTGRRDQSMIGAKSLPELEE